MKQTGLVVALCGLLVSGYATAQAYVGGKAGATWLDDSCLGSESCDDDAFGGGIFAGYEMTENFAFEIGYDYLGKFTGGGLDDDPITAVTLAPKFSFPVYDDWLVYLKAGAGIVNFDDGDETDVSFLGAVGGEYRIDPHWGVRLEYQLLTDMNNDVVRAAGNMITLGLSYKFGGAKQPVIPVAETRPEAQPVMPEKMVQMEKKPEPVKILKKQLSGVNTFALDSAKLIATESLMEVVEVLNQYPQSHVKITGYTDSQGSADYNQKLSEKRAEAVSRFIISKGIDASRVSSEGMGEANPVASNETKEGRQQNRRVEIAIPVFEYQESR